MNMRVSQKDCEIMTERLCKAMGRLEGALVFTRVNDLYRVRLWSTGEDLSYIQKGTKSEVYGQIRMCLAVLNDVEKGRLFVMEQDMRRKDAQAGRDRQD